MNDITWLVEYKDGTAIQQRDGDAFVAYEDIDREQLSAFVLHRGGKVIACIKFDDDGSKLFWTRRVYQTLGEEARTVHILGKRDQFVMAVMQDDSIVIRHDFIPGDWLFDTVGDINNV